MLKIENLLVSFFGITTVFTFVLVILAGGILSSPEAIIFKEVSFAISPYSSFQDLTVPLYVAYNICLLLFSFCLLIRLQNLGGKFGAFYLFCSAIIGIALIYFPMDPQGISESIQGSSHIAILLLISTFAIIGLLLLAIAFKKTSNLRYLTAYSNDIALILLAAGLITGASALLSNRILVGTIEKIPIIAFLIWILATSLGILNSDKRIKSYGIFETNGTIKLKNKRK
jgi:hypothetical protein